MYLLIAIKILLISQEILSDNVENIADFEEQLYVKIFKLRRAEQLEAVKGLQKITNRERQLSMLMMLTEKVFVTIQESRATMEASNYIPGVSPFPIDDKAKNALSNILENTALFSEIVLRLPDLTVPLLKSNNNWNLLFQWSIAFSNQVRYLLDKGTLKLLNLVSQELGHIERDSNYHNPYRASQKQSTTVPESNTNKINKKKKKPIKKGPRLTNYEL